MVKVTELVSIRDVRSPDPDISCYGTRSYPRPRLGVGTVGMSAHARKVTMWVTAGAALPPELRLLLTWT